MNTRIITLCFFQVLLVFNNLDAQTGGNGNPVIPLQQNRSVLFGSDIVIHNEPDQDQRQVAVCSAFNGWLYAVNTYHNSFYNCGAFTILISIDNGISWTVLNDGYYPIDNTELASVDLVLIGDTTSNLKLFFGFVVTSLASTVGLGELHVFRFDGITGVYEDVLLQYYNAYSFSMSNDFMYPAISSSPHSLGILYTARYSSTDSLIFKSSSDGGMTLNNQQIIAGSGNHFRKVKLAYGRSLSQNTGRYYAVWEEKSDFISNTGHIYTSHSEPNFDSPFTTPVNLDSIDPSALNNARNPAISCQFNDTDNDSSNLTEVIFFEKYLPLDDKYGIVGFYNMKSTNTNHFNQFNLNTSTDNLQEPNVHFNPFNDKFMLTYYNATEQKLPFLQHNFNMINPDDWEIVSSGYNDSSILSFPYPKVTLNQGMEQGAVVWTREETTGNRVALFDAPYLYTGIFPKESISNRLFRIYPNPCTNSLNVAFQINNTGKVTISLYNIIGNPVDSILDRLLDKGQYIINYDISNISPGSYLLTFRQGNDISSYKVFVSR